MSAVGIHALKPEATEVCDACRRPAVRVLAVARGKEQVKVICFCLAHLRELRDIVDARVG